MRRVQVGRTQANPRGCRAPDRASTSKERGRDKLAATKACRSQRRLVGCTRRGNRSEEGADCSVRHEEILGLGSSRLRARTNGCRGTGGGGSPGDGGGPVSRMWKHPSSGFHSAQSSVRPDFVSGVSSSAPVRSLSSGVAMRFHHWKRARGASSIVASGLASGRASSLACRQDTAEHRFGWQEFRT